MRLEDFDKPIEMAFLEENIDEETYSQMNATQQYVYLTVRSFRNKLKMNYLNELIEAKKEAMEKLTTIELLAALKGI